MEKLSRPEAWLLCSSLATLLFTIGSLFSL